MTLEPQKVLLKTPCCNAAARADVIGSSSVTVTDEGYISCNGDIYYDGINRDYFWCDECGEEVILQENSSTGKYQFVETSDSQ